MAKKKKSDPSFEQAITELETIVTSMESGDVSLEDSLAAFEKGIALTRTCQAALKNAEQKIKILSADGGIEEFKPASNTDDDN